MRIDRDTLRRDVTDTRQLVWLLVTGELITPRGTPGPLARPWAARGSNQRRRAAAGRPGDRDRKREG